MANLFIVPHDFTEAGDAALFNSFFLAKPRKAEIKLLHIVSDKSKGAQAHKKLEDIIAKHKEAAGDLKVTPLVKVGSIFEDIGGIAEENEAKLIIMGTHGAKGMQKLFGSYAIKVVTSTSVPFLVVQKDKKVMDDIKSIVVPIDLSKESLQIINTAGDVARMFGAKIHVVGEKQSDPRLAQQIKIRISIVKKEFEEKNVDSEVHVLEGSKSYQHKIMQFALENKSDMIAVAYYNSSLFPQFDSYFQSLISNKENIPCLIANSKLLSKLYF
jgi:nucleotide-binding universal stress UspA family protein